MDLIEDSQANIEDKIRRALQGPDLLSPKVEETPKHVSAEKINKKKISFVRYFKLLLIALMVSAFYLARTDSNINLLATGFILKSEKVAGSNFSLLRSLLKVKLSLTADEFCSLIEKNDLAMASMLLNWGLDANSINSKGDTLLIDALKQRKNDAVAMLIGSYANVNLSNPKGESALEFAIPDEALVLMLVKAGVDINVRDLSQRTNLIKAVIDNDLNLVKLLIKSGADVNLQDNFGKTALHYAFDANNKDLIEYLKSVGADANISDKSGKKAELIIEDKKAQDWWQDNKKEEVKPEAKIAAKVNKMTAVRVIGKVQGVFQTSSSVVLKEASVEVRNVGDEVANGVKVMIKIPGAKDANLTGPSVLQPYTTVKFTASLDQTITRAGELRAIVSCENCHR